MFKWAQGAVAAVTGSAEPEYGAGAFQAVDKAVEGKNPFGALERKDLEWQQPAQSHVETQVFYFNAPNGYYGFAQIIHSNPVNVSYTSQCTFLLKHKTDKDFKIWTSTALSEHKAAATDFKAERFEVTLNPEANEYTFKALMNPESIIDLKIKLVDQGFKIGKDGVSKYGEDLNKPWGTMRHIFWPRTVVNGTIVTAKGPFEIQNAQGMFVMALQGMKPHHAAARWNFLNFQGPESSVIVMEFTTPTSYGSSKSSIGGIVKGGKLVGAFVNVDTEHLSSKVDEVGWPAPTKIAFKLDGKSIDDKQSITAEVSGNLDYLVDRVDVMAEIPAFVKRVVAGVSGAKPYIYQYMNELTAKITIDGETFEEKGDGYCEVTFIS